ncbi:hypothetical protein [Mixta calida]|uniref:hypothetical protein n=1 Tax=Mixta calida TaxID=665913 RepID=UPI00289C53A7|nr:hypothetical protein [Mixta calida]
MKPSFIQSPTVAWDDEPFFNGLLARLPAKNAASPMFEKKRAIQPKEAQHG